MTALQAWLDAATPWKRDKYRLVERYREANQTCEKGAILFTGSSLMEMFPVERFAREEGPDFPVVYNRGVGGWRTEDMLLCLNEMVLDLQPRRLFINIGTNDLSDASVTIADLTGRYEQIITTIEATVPGVEIILMAYYPINYEAAAESMKACLRIRTNERIREANEAVKHLAERHNQRYMDFNAPLMDEQGRLRAEFTIEGMHIKEDGYRAIWPLVREAILADQGGLTMTDKPAPLITFEDYRACPDDGIKSLTAQGILLENGNFIDFAECAANFAALHGGSGRCVGERDISGSNPSFGFYTAPLTTHIFFMPRGRFGRKDALRRFHEMQKQIESFGFTTYDMT